MAKRKERREEIYREKVKSAWRIPEPHREDFKTNRDWLIAIEEYNIQQQNFFDPVEGVDKEPDPWAVTTFRRIMSELTPEEVAGWNIYIDIDGDCIYVEPLVPPRKNNTNMTVNAWIGFGRMGITEHEDTEAGYLAYQREEIPGPPPAFGITRLKEWMKAITEKYNIPTIEPEDKNKKPLGN